MNSSLDAASSLAASVACAAIVGRLLTAAVMPMLRQLEACFAADAAAGEEHGHAVDQRSMPACPAESSGVAAAPPPLPRRGPAAVIPVAG